MGETIRFLGHVAIVPNLNQAEYDHLVGFDRAVDAGDRAATAGSA